jgi:hypothetical protein
MIPLGMGTFKFEGGMFAELFDALKVNIGAMHNYMNIVLNSVLIF